MDIVAWLCVCLYVCMDANVSVCVNVFFNVE